MTSTLADRVVLQSDELTVAVVPEKGARVTSVLNRRDRREWLTQPRGRSRVWPPLEVFTDSDHFGLDEMCPSVDPCQYPVAPYEGRWVPDHGELWRGIWEVVESADDSITQRFHSQRFGYTFERRTELRGSSLRLDYRLEVNGPAVSLLWALHPQFSMRPGSRLVLPGQRDVLLDTTAPLSPTDVAWPGELIVERDVADGEDRMYYLHPDDVVKEATLVDDTGSWLSLRWDSLFARYLGIWVDRGRHGNGHVVAVEPTNGFFDDLERCYQRGTVPEYVSNDLTTFWVEICVGEGAL
ncbi:MAG: hypothetical protein ACRDVC_11060 [Acidimicrobiales bacterium]